MENIQFEITHDRLVALIAKFIDVSPEQITLLPVADEMYLALAIANQDCKEGHAPRIKQALQGMSDQGLLVLDDDNKIMDIARKVGVKAVIRTDLPTANKIDRKLKRLDGEPANNTEGEAPAQE